MFLMIFVVRKLVSRAPNLLHKGQKSQICVSSTGDIIGFYEKKLRNLFKSNFFFPDPVYALVQLLELLFMLSAKKKNQIISVL